GIDPRQLRRGPSDFGDLVFTDPVDPTETRWGKLSTTALNTGDRPLLPSELTHLWADVDNTGDGVKDAMWIPVPQDVDFSDDGIDNDLDGVIDNPGEVARFLYWDETAQRMMLTAPIVAYGVPLVVIPDVRVLPEEGTAVDTERLAFKYGIADDDMAALNSDPTRWSVVSSYNHLSVDRLDNDHDFIEGNARTIDLRFEISPPG